MAELKITSTDYRELDAYLGTKDARSIGHNTLLRRTWSGDELAVQLHGTDVVTIRPTGEITYRTGGWYSTTTKDRMGQFRPAGVCGPFGPHQRKGCWYFTDALGTQVAFREGLTVDRNGVLV